MANTKITTNVIADDAVTSDKLGGDLTMPGHVSLADNKELRVGTGNDLVIKHDGSHTTLTNTTGNFTLLGDVVYIGNAANSEYLAQFIANGACSLRFNDTEELATVSGGVYIPNKLGIGTNAPGAILSLPAGESNTPRFAIESAVDDNDFTITQYEDSNGTYTMLGQNVKLNSSGNNTVLDSAHRTAGIFLDARSHGAITFITGEANTATEHVKIDSTGKVGIGTTSPAEMLEIYNTTSPAIQLNDGGEYKAIMRLAGNDLELRSSSGNMEFYTGNADGDSSAERLRITSNGTFLLGTTATRVMSGVGPKFFIEGTDYATSSMGIVINANGANDCPALFFGKSRGTSDGSNTVVQNGDRVFSMRMDGSDGTNLEQVAIIEAHVDGTVANNSIPGRMTFMTTNTGSQYATEKMRIDNMGRVTMPSQPAAIYHYTNANQDGAYGYSWPGTGAQSIICKPQGATLNRGSMYNSSTGAFTAPVAGVYRWAVHGNLYTNNLNSTAYYYVRIYKNTSHYIYNYESNTINNANGWVYVNMGGIISMAASDYLRFELATNNLSSSGVNGFGFDLSQYTHFEFQLLY